MKRASLLACAGILAVVAFVVSQAPTGAQERAVVGKWEYKVFVASVDASQPYIEASLNELGAEGWEAVSHDSLGTTYFRCILKRPKN